MNNPLEYLSCNRREWYSDIPMRIAQKSTKLWLGKGLLFDSEKENILKYFTNKIISDKWFEKLYKFGIQESLLGKVYIMPIIYKDNSTSLKVLPNSFAGRVAKYNEEEQCAEFFFINEQADSATLTWVIAENGKIRFETYKNDNKNEKEIILGTAHTKLKPNLIPKYSYEIKNPWNYLPILEITNLPMVNFYGNSTTLNAYPDTYPVWNLIEYYHKSYTQRNVDRELNVTTLFGAFDNETVKNMIEHGKIIDNPKKNIVVNVGTASYNKSGAGGMEVIQGDFKASNYILDKDDLGKDIWNGAGYDYNEFSGVNYENKTKSLFNNKNDMETTETKISHYSYYFYRFFDMLLIHEKLWDGIGDRPYSFKFLPIAMTDQLLKQEMISQRLADRTMSYTQAIAELDEVTKQQAKKHYKEIMEEDKEEIKLLGENKNDTSTNSINETSTSSIKKTTIAN